ncbi:hypothetical protein BDR05DRAFT_133832 [Suillus weaverae]|nr:hypothetical protein BDR05DRAFT_133832 [Suillus weaverae]
MDDAAQPIILSTTPAREFEGHEDHICALAPCPDKRRMVTGSEDNTLCLWDLEGGNLVKKMEGHPSWVQGVAVSRDGQLIASGDMNGQLIAWDGDTGEPLIQPIKAHNKWINWLDLSPDGTTLASGSWDQTTKLWNTQTWQLQGDPIHCGSEVACVRYSPFGELLAIVTRRDVQIFNTRTGRCTANFKAHAVINSACNVSLVWAPGSTRLLSGGCGIDLTIREWDTLTWKQVGDPWTGHTDAIRAISVNCDGTLVASASDDCHVRLWRFSDRRTIAIFKHSNQVHRVTFSMDSQHILSGGKDKKILKWAVPGDVWPDSKIVILNPAIRNACISGHLTIAEKLLTEEIHACSNSYNSYANRSFVMARKREWDHALHDAVKSIAIKPSLIGCISKGIALCGKMQFQDAMKAFDLGSTFTNRDTRSIYPLLLIKAIALFNADQHSEAIIRIQELALCPNADIHACQIVEAYLCIQLGINALDGAHYNEAVDHFTAAVKVDAWSSKSAIRSVHFIYDDFVVLFGWDLESLWRTANQKRCDTLLRAGRLREAHESYQYMMDMSDEVTKANYLDSSWSTAFKQDCSARYAANGDVDLVACGDAALAASDYDRAIELSSVVIDLGFATDSVFATRSKAKLKKALWEDALIDAQKVIELNPSSYLGYHLKHAALHGSQRYDEAIDAFEMMLFMLDHAPDPQVRELRLQHASRSDTEGAIQEAIHVQLENAPHRSLNTFTGLICNQEAQINAFNTSTEYKELLLAIMQHGDLRIERIEEVVVQYFRCAMLSHRWEASEPLFRDIQNKVVYNLNPVGGIAKLQFFCKTARDAGCRWAWMDSCCIDQNNPVELQESVNSMFVWYRHSALTIIYLADVTPSSKSGALAKSAWITRGWTVQEFLAPSIVLFYQQDWSLYLDDRSSNHKKSVAIMRELGDVTRIDAQALIAFHPGMRGAREKLQWVSTRVTTLQEDIAYSLFGIFGVHLPVLYGEKKQNALGRLLQEIVALSGDISALDWAGKSSEFNSCLPASITSYQAPSHALPSLSEDEMQISISSLRDNVIVDVALALFSRLDYICAPRFAQRRLHLPCIVFPVTEVRRRRSEDQETYLTYEVKADGLHDLQIITDDKLLQFSRARPIRQTFLLVRPWDRRLLELPDFADDVLGVDDMTPPESPVSDSPGLYLAGQGQADSESAQQRGGEYKRIASDRDIIAQAKDVASVHNMMDVRTLEIL